jgi:TIGR03009 family protein
MEFVRATHVAALLLAAGLMGQAAAQQPPAPAIRRHAPPAVAAPAAATPGSQQPAAQGPARPPINAVQPKTTASAAAARQPFQLDEGQRQRLEELLGHWELRSGKVNTYSCDFTRYEYDHVFGPQDPRYAKTKSEGIIRYSSPDKGEFKIERALEYQAPQDDKSAPNYVPVASEANEHWICDGRSVFELNGAKQQLIQQELPPELQGKKIADGPLPFMFGAEKKKLEQRYWIREVLPPSERKNEFWFEAFPKTREDAANYHKLMVILDADNFLPTALQIFPPNYDARTNPSRTVYTFSNREVDNLMHRSKQFFDRFISPKTPRGWKKVVMQFGGSAGAGPAAQTARQPTDQAQRPAAPPAR